MTVPVCLCAYVLALVRLCLCAYVLVSLWTAVPVDDFALPVDDGALV